MDQLLTSDLGVLVERVSKLERRNRWLWAMVAADKRAGSQGVEV